MLLFWLCAAYFCSSLRNFSSTMSCNQRFIDASPSEIFWRTMYWPDSFKIMRGWADDGCGRGVVEIGGVGTRSTTGFTGTSSFSWCSTNHLFHWSRRSFNMLMCAVWETMRSWRERKSAWSSLLVLLTGLRWSAAHVYVADHTTDSSAGEGFYLQMRNLRREISHNAHYSLQNSQRHIELQIWSKEIHAERRLKDLALHSKDRERESQEK